MSQNRSKWQIQLFLIVISLGIYVYGAHLQITEVNTDMQATDQYAYMVFTRTMVESDYTYWGDRNRMPLYPLLQSIFYDGTVTDELFFYRGKVINLALSVVILLGLWWVFQLYLDPIPAVLLWLITAFQVFIFKAGFFQAELLFYFTSFCLFLLFARHLHTPDWRLALVTGILAGLTHLTKASVLPGLALFIALALGQWGWQLISQRNRDEVPDHTTPLADASQRLAYSIQRFKLNQLMGIILIPAFFLLTVSPYILESKQIFGHYFYNVNSTFYIWYDSWEEAKQGTRAYGDRVGWPDMPPEEIPSLSKYLAEHTWAQIGERFSNGAYVVYRNVVTSYGYHRYLFFYLALLLATVALNYQASFALFQQNPFVALFGLGYFNGYLILYSWYAPIAAGNRFVLALFTPLFFSLFYVLKSVRDHKEEEDQTNWVGPVLSSIPYLHYLVLFLLAIDIYLVITVRVATQYGGR